LIPRGVNQRRARHTFFITRLLGAEVPTVSVNPTRGVEPMAASRRVDRDLSSPELTASTAMRPHPDPGTAVCGRLDQVTRQQDTKSSHLCRHPTAAGHPHHGLQRGGRKRDACHVAFHPSRTGNVLPLPTTIPEKRSKNRCTTPGTTLPHQTAFAAPTRRSAVSNAPWTAPCPLGRRGTLRWILRA
jgi:hypothetical protein